MRALRLMGLAALLAACAPLATPAPPASLAGRWHRLEGAPLGEVGDPLATLAQPDLELRDDGLLADLIAGAEPGRVYTTMMGHYTVTDASHLRIDGRCWHGYESYACAQTYPFTLAGDHLTVRGPAGSSGQLDYQRVGPAAADLPPTLVPPGPSPTP